MSGLVFAVGADGCSRLVSLVFPRRRLRYSGVHTHVSFSIWFLMFCRCVFFWCWWAVHGSVHLVRCRHRRSRHRVINNRSPMSLMCSVMCSWAAPSSSVNGRTWDRALLTTEPRYTIQTVANVLLITTPRCQKALVVFFCSVRSKTREVVQRAVRPCSVLLRGAELVSIDVCDPMPGLPVGQCVS